MRAKREANTMPSAVRAKLLLGWMEETEAMQWLLKEYAGDIPFTEETAKELWQKYRDKVALLPQRTATPPTCLVDRTQKERYEEDYFIKKHAKKPHILRVVKLDDPSKLVIHQLMVVLPQSERYLSAMKDHGGRTRTSLGRGLSFEGVHPKARKEGNLLIKTMPHAEFSVTRSDQEDFDVREEDRHIAVKEFGGRMLLHAGYHRAHISMYRSAPEETVLPLFAALESDVDGFFSVGSKLPFKRDMVRGGCPPLLGDFFDDFLCIELPLRKCGAELCVDLTTRKWSRLWPDAC